MPSSSGAMSEDQGTERGAKNGLPESPKRFGTPGRKSEPCRPWGRLPAAPVANLERRADRTAVEASKEADEDGDCVLARSPSPKRSEPLESPPCGRKSAGELWARCRAAEAARERLEAELKADKDSWEAERNLLLSKLDRASAARQKASEGDAAAAGALLEAAAAIDVEKVQKEAPEAVALPSSPAQEVPASPGSTTPPPCCQSCEGCTTKEVLSALQTAVSEMVEVERTCLASAAATEASLRHLQDRLAALSSNCAHSCEARAEGDALGFVPSAPSPIDLCSLHGVSPAWSSSVASPRRRSLAILGASMPATGPPKAFTWKPLRSARPSCSLPSWAQPSQTRRRGRRGMVDQLYELPEFVSYRADQVQRGRLQSMHHSH